MATLRDLTTNLFNQGKQTVNPILQSIGFNSQNILNQASQNRAATGTTIVNSLRNLGQNLQKIPNVNIPQIPQVAKNVINSIPIPGVKTFTSPIMQKAIGLGSQSLTEDIRGKGRTLERVTQPQYLQKTIASAKQIPQQVKTQGLLSAFSNPAIEDVLNYADVLGGASMLKKGVVGLAEKLPTTLSPGKINFKAFVPEVKDVKSVVKRLTNLGDDDIRIMENYYDMVKKSPKATPNQELATLGNYIADYLGIKNDASPSVVANQFQEILQIDDQLKKGGGFARIGKGNVIDSIQGIGQFKTEKALGMKVKSMDRGNYGHVYRINKDGTVTVQFINKEKNTKSLVDIHPSRLKVDIGTTLEEFINPTTRKKPSGVNKVVETVKPSNPILDSLGIQQQQVIPGATQKGNIQPQKFSSEDIISEAKKQIGSIKEEKGKPLSQVASDLYTQWVDRYNPITKASERAKKVLSGVNATLRPEYDPSVLVRRLTGAGGIADQRYQTILKPIIDEMDSLKIDKGDLDVYLKARRDIGLGQRGIKGSNVKTAQQIMQSVESKYGNSVKNISQKLYDYQNQGFQEMIDAGFISPEVGKTIRSQNPDYVPFERVMDEVDNYLGVPTRKTMQGTQPISKIKGSERQIYSPVESIIANTFKQRAAIEKNRVAKSIVGLQEVAPELGFSKTPKSGNDTITIWNNGKKEFWKVGTEIAESAKGLNEENMNALLKIFTTPASLLRQGATGRNPEFMLPNIIRDQLDAAVTSKYGYIPFVDFLSGLKSMVKNDEVYKAWANSGAKIDLGEMSGRKSISEAFNETKAKKGLFSWLGKGLDIMGKYSEQPTRVGLFKKAYQKTGNPLLSMMESRDATVDFARMGSKMKVANSIVPFLNVGVQGFDKLIRSVKNNPGKVALNATIYGALPTITTTLYNLTNHPEEYAEIPQYEKDANFVLIKGRNDNGTVDYVTIPKGNIIPVISNPIENLMSYMAGTNPQTLSEFATQFVSSTLPVVGDGQSISEVAVKTIGSNLPQLIKPAAENLLNKSFYKYDPKKEQSKEIVPTYLQKREPYQQSYEWTPQMYKSIGAVLNVSPLKVQNMMEGYLAGYAKIPSQLIDGLKNLSEGKEVPTNQKTILRRFVKETYPSSSKPAEIKPKTPLMERITGKAKATEGEVSDAQIESAKYKLKQSNETVSKLGNLYLLKQSNGDIEKINISTPISEPKLTDSEELNKKLISKYKGQITSRGNDIVKLYEAGEIDATKAEQMLNELKVKAQSYNKPKKGKKPKKITIKVPKLRRIKVAALKPIKAIKIKKLKFKKYTPKKIKL